MGYKVTIDTTEISANCTYQLNIVPKMNENGTVEYREVFLDVEAQVREDTPALVADKLKIYFDLAALTNKLVPVTIKLDDVEKFSFQPGSCVFGPTVSGFQTLEADGNGGSLWRFQIGVYARLPGNNFEGLFDLQTSLLVIRNAVGDVIRKVWRASAKAKTVTLAKSAILGFKPSGAKNITEELEEFYQERRISGMWVWDKNRQTVLCNVHIIGADGDVIDPQIPRGTKPLLHEARKQPTRIIIVGRVTGDETIKAPPAHFKQSATMRRQPREEDNEEGPSYKSDEDVALGKLSLDFMEVWLCTEDKPPKANHGDHAIGKAAAGKSPEPPAGKIAISAGG